LYKADSYLQSVPCDSLLNKDCSGWWWSEQQYHWSGPFL